MKLITSDPHFTDRPRDAYRFGLFKWLMKEQERHSVNATFILGDLTQNKDRHSSTLVNRIVDELIKLKPPIYILRGNHDGIDPNDPFFRFLSNIEGIEFVVRPKYLKGLGVAMVPHCRTQAEFDESCGVIQPKSNAVMLHNTFEGAIAETGAALSGLRASPAAFKGAKGVWSGDVHKPQQAGPLTYVGCPYHVRFGDAFNPRVLLLDSNWHSKDLTFECPRKWVLRINDTDALEHNKDLSKGDQVKIVIQLFREEIVEWPAYRRRALDIAKDRGLEVFGCDLEVKGGVTKKAKKIEGISRMTNTALVESFCKREKVASEIREVGTLLVEE